MKTTLMRRRWQSHGLLGMLFFMLLGWVVWLTNQPEAHRPYLLSADWSQLTMMSIERYPDTPQAKSVFITKQLEQSNAQWQAQTNPGDSTNSRHVDLVKLQQLLTLAREEVVREYAVEALNLQEYALQPGYVRLIFHFQNPAHSEQLTFGMSHPVSGLRYVLHDQRMKLINEAVFSLLMDEQAF